LKTVYKYLLRNEVTDVGDGKITPCYGLAGIKGNRSGITVCEVTFCVTPALLKVVG
jgi:hypothetical protein